MFKKLIVLAGAMMALVGLSGCFEMESVISLKKDGSGTLTETVTMGAQMLGMMKMGGEDVDPFADFNDEALKEKAESYGEGIEFVSVNKEEKNGGAVITISYKFADISKVIYKPGQAMDNGGEDKGEPITFGFQDGNLTVLVPDPSKEDMGFGEEDMGEEEMAMMAPMMAGAKISAKIVCEGGIEETNASFQEDNSITLLSMNFDEILKNEGGFAVMKKLAVESREEFGEAVTAIDGIEVESKEKVTVKLK